MCLAFWVGLCVSLCVGFIALLSLFRSCALSHERKREVSQQRWNSRSSSPSSLLPSFSSFSFFLVRWLRAETGSQVAFECIGASSREGGREGGREEKMEGGKARSDNHWSPE